MPPARCALVGEQPAGQGPDVQHQLFRRKKLTTALARRSPDSAHCITAGTSEARPAAPASAAHRIGRARLQTCAAVRTAPTRAVSGSRPSADAVTTLKARRPIQVPPPSSPHTGPTRRIAQAFRTARAERDRSGPGDEHDARSVAERIVQGDRRVRMHHDVRRRVPTGSATGGAPGGRAHVPHLRRRRTRRGPGVGTGPQPAGPPRSTLATTAADWLASPGRMALGSPSRGRAQLRARPRRSRGCGSLPPSTPMTEASHWPGRRLAPGV